MTEHTVGASDKGAEDKGVRVSRRGMSKEQYGNRNNDGRMSDGRPLAWVELVEPNLDEVIPGMGQSAVVVPLLLPTGMHRGRPSRPL